MRSLLDKVLVHVGRGSLDVGLVGLNALLNGPDVGGLQQLPTNELRIVHTSVVFSLFLGILVKERQ